MSKNTNSVKAVKNSAKAEKNSAKAAKQAPAAKAEKTPKADLSQGKNAFGYRVSAERAHGICVYLATQQKPVSSKAIAEATGQSAVYGHMTHMLGKGFVAYVDGLWALTPAARKTWQAWASKNKGKAKK